MARTVTRMVGPDNLSTITSYVAHAEARDWDAFDRLLHPDVVYEIPQTRERVAGRARLRASTPPIPVTGISGLAEAYTDDKAGWRGSTGGSARARPAPRSCSSDSTRRVVISITDWWPEPYEPPPGREHLVERW